MVKNYIIYKHIKLTIILTYNQKNDFQNASLGGLVEIGLQMYLQKLTTTSKLNYIIMDGINKYLKNKHMNINK